LLERIGVIDVDRRYKKKKKKVKSSSVSVKQTGSIREASLNEVALCVLFGLCESDYANNQSWALYGLSHR
jgi:hypothetical protein